MCFCVKARVPLKPQKRAPVDPTLTQESSRMAGAHLYVHTTFRWAMLSEQKKRKSWVREKLNIHCSLLQGHLGIERWGELKTLRARWVGLGSMNVRTWWVHWERICSFLCHDTRRLLKVWILSRVNYVLFAKPTPFSFWWPHLCRRRTSVGNAGNLGKGRNPGLLFCPFVSSALE